jgi:hypothetical protein
VATGLRNQRLCVRLTQSEFDLFEAARRALHARGVVRELPSQADSLVLLAGLVCHRFSQGGFSERHLQCRAALAAWQGEHSQGYLQLLLGPWLGASTAGDAPGGPRQSA